jgi:hypothetical protein
MKSRILTMALLGLVSICLFVVPAFSMPTGNCAFNGPCNVSDKNCNASWSGGMHGMGNPEMDHPKMGMMGSPYMAMHGMSHAKMENCRNASWNKTSTVEIHQAGKGFAIGDDQNHILWMRIVGQINPDPDEIQKLISENKTLAQIESDIKAKMDAEISAASYNGSLRLGENDYNLANIKVALSDENNATIEADVVGPKANPEDKPTAAAGRITVTASQEGDSTIGEGILTITSGQYSGKYNVLLNMGHSKGMFGRMGAHAFAFGGMNQKCEGFGMNAGTNETMPKIWPRNPKSG